jgi:hypothetical protein
MVERAGRMALRLHKPTASTATNYFLNVVGKPLFHRMEKGSAQEFEGRVRAVCVPNERVSDIFGWHKNTHFVAWLRQAYLNKVFTNTNEYQACSALDMMTLPTHKEALDVFGIGHWIGHDFELPTLDAANGRREELLVGCDMNTSTADWTLEDVIEAGGGSVAGRGVFNAYCEQSGTYDFLTQEYITELALHIQEVGAAIQRKRQKESSLDQGDTPLLVLEVGAGNGILTHHLGKELQKLEQEGSSDSQPVPSPSSTSSSNKKATHKKAIKRKRAAARQKKSAMLNTEVGSGQTRMMVVATDHSLVPVPSPSSSSAMPALPAVEEVDYKKAIAKYQPDIVLCAWMPMGVDWTSSFRECDRVQAYTLVGEADDGNCGHNWLTWGNPDFAPEDVKRVGSKNKQQQQHQKMLHSRKSIAAQAPHLGAGSAGSAASSSFKRMNVDTAAKYQLQRYDSEQTRFNSRTVTFLRDGLKLN